MELSCISKFYKLSIAERISAVRERSLISDEDYQALLSGEHTLKLHSADKMIENVVGVLGLPLGLGLNFLINGKDYIVPLAVEEASIVAALSSAAKVARQSGGFLAESSEPILIGQVQVVDIPNTAKAKAAILQNKEEIINLANSFHPKMVARGGGAEDVEVHIHSAQGTQNDMLIVHLLVNTCDAMGANLVNTMCEGIASLVETLTGGKVFLRILSNLTDRALVRASVSIPIKNLAHNGFDGEQVRDGIVLATDFAKVDPYRATTHNKGVMNGVDAVAIATGNDWRAIEAAAHAYAARGGRYTSLTDWTTNDQGDLVGSIDIPLKVGIVGGPLKSNPSVAVNLRLMGIESARELAEVMGAVGLAQNFSALRALVTDGIQRGHMSLHARTVAMSAGATPEIFDDVVERLIESQDIKIWKAKAIIEEVSSQSKPNDTIVGPEPDPDYAAGYGKVILFGEHAVVYGRHAVAAPIPLAIQVKVDDAEQGVNILIPRWGVEYRLHENEVERHSFDKSLGLILKHLGLTDRAMHIEVFPNLPRAMGLGGSSAMAVAIIRALNRHFDLKLTDGDVNNLAFESEKVAHGTPSGIDNTVATYGKFIVYRRAEQPLMEEIHVSKPIPMVIGMSGIESLTAKMVAQVRTAWEKNQSLYERIFDQIDSLSLEGIKAITDYDLEKLGDLMNVCHGLLNGLRLSTWELEEMIQIARHHGALGAKLTGGGGGGSMIALCPDNAAAVVSAMKQAGYQAMEVNIG